MAALAIAACAIACAAALPGAPEVGAEAPDTVPPEFTSVPPCFIEALATSTGTTVECKTPSATGSTSLTVERPTTMSPGSAHTLAWKDDGTQTHQETLASVPVGTHTAEWTASDAAGNVAMTTQVIVVQDTRPPTLTISKGTQFTVEAISPDTDLASAGDSGVSAPADGEASPPVTLSTRPATLPVPEEEEYETVTWRATDAAGNASTVRTRILVLDESNPEITPDPPPRVTLYETKPAAITREQAGVDVKDDADPNPVLRPKPSTLPVGSKAAPVKWTAFDESLNSDTVTQEVTVTDFRVTSAEFRNNGIEITFSHPVKQASATGILVGKWGQVHAGSIGTNGLSSTITATGSKVRIAPTLSSSGATGFCGETDASASCVDGLLAGTWVVSLPGALSSTVGNPLYAAPAPGNPLYKDGKPKLESCIEWGGAQTNTRTREVADLQGCVGIVNSGQSPTFTTWTRTYAPGSAPPNVAPVLSALIPAGTDRVLLDWKPGSAPSTTYTVEKSVKGGAFVPATVTLVNATRATDAVTAADLGSGWSYRVAETTNGVTTRSNEVTVNIPKTIVSPENVGGDYVDPQSYDIRITWAHAPLASGYIVYEFKNGSNHELVRTTETSYYVVASSDISRTFKVVSYLGTTISASTFSFALAKLI